MLLFSRASLELLFSNFMQLLFSNASRGLLFSHDSYKLPHNRAGLQPNGGPQGRKRLTTCQAPCLLKRNVLETFLINYVSQTQLAWQKCFFQADMLMLA